MKRFYLIGSLILICISAPTFGADSASYFPQVTEQQLPKKMHSPMKELPAITVGLDNADLVGNDNRVIQAAVDYVANLGGGTVKIGPGKYLMNDSLHLRSFVTVIGEPGKTILVKADAASSPLVLDGDFGEEQVTVKNPEGFMPGKGITIWDKNANGFHTTVARITGKNGNTFSMSKPLNADCMVANGAMAATLFPVVSGYDVEGVCLKHLIIEGNKEKNGHLNGCRGGGIFLYRGFGTVIDGCVVRNFNGDGISFQQSNDVIVQNCTSEYNTSLGLHPGSGSQRPTVRQCTSRFNGEDGLFLCWRVRFGVFQENIIEDNGRYGISIGHKDTDNLLSQNQVRRNSEEGVYFRNETLGMAGHRNRLEKNVIENNNSKRGNAAIRIRGETIGVVLKNNIIRDTRPEGEKKQTVGIFIESSAGDIVMEGNSVEAPTPVQDQRPK